MALWNNLACQNLIVPSTYKNSIVFIPKQTSHKYHNYLKAYESLVHMTGWTRRSWWALLTLSLFSALPISWFKKLACFHPLRHTLWINLKRVKLIWSKINIILHNSESHGLFHHFIYVSFKCQLLRKIFFVRPLYPSLFLFLTYFIKSNYHYSIWCYIFICLVSFFPT